MAKNATIYKARINIADFSRNFYFSDNLTIAQHPSETLERMMHRLIAWSMFAEENLKFTKGLCVKNEPEIWSKNDIDDIKLWIDIGLPDKKSLVKACNRSQRVVLFVCNDKAANQWKKQVLNKLHDLHNLTVIHILDEVLASAAKLATRTMDIQVNIENGQIGFAIENNIIAIEPQTWKIDSF